MLREESAWTFRDRYLRPTDDEFIDAMRDGLKLAAARGVTALHDKDGWLGAPRLWQRLLDDGLLTLRVWQSLPAEHLDGSMRSPCPRASAATCCASAT